MNSRLIGAMSALAVIAGMSVGAAHAQSGEISVWAWNISAPALRDTIPDFNKKYPDVKVNVIEAAGGGEVYTKILANCAAGGVDLPDVIGVQNSQGETIWSRFPDCFTDLIPLGYTPEEQALFPDFKRSELEAGGKAYAMPWDSGPVMMFYRRDYYEKAGVDPATIVTWDDFIAAGKKVQEANPGVTMIQADLIGGTEFMEMMGQEQHCNFFDVADGSITVNQPGCVAALEKIKAMKDAGILSAADWGGKLQAISANSVATAMFGAWYASSIQTAAPDQSGKWGIFRMPSVTAEGGARAANAGGSALAINANSKNKEAAMAFVKHALETNEGQVTMLKTQGLIPSLLSALADPYVNEANAYWGGQPIFKDILATLPDVPPARATAFYGDAAPVVNVAQTKFLNGEIATAKEALDGAAQQIAAATGLPVH